jgi:SAM-dependent methyltransferase
MNRTEIINGLIRRRRYRRYLEIGVADPRQNFDRVDCPRKVAVDPAPGPRPVDHRATSDDFFRSCPDTFDLIFIDGFHEEEQVARDIRNARDHLRTGGAVVIHDCLPPDEWHQRPHSEYRLGEDWNGTVWKGVLRHFADCPWACYIVDADWGCGVIDTAGTRDPKPFAVPERLEYREHFRLLWPFVRSEAQFLSRL